MTTNFAYKQSLEKQLVQADVDLAEARLMYRHALQMRDTLAAEWERLKALSVSDAEMNFSAAEPVTLGLPTARLAHLAVPVDAEFASASFNGCGF